ncbi:MAG: ABC transporter ATP-binding protein [Desulfobacterales bacterium]|nr:ABC transporter ATP-binding protein [Desulfobacterales bacterium]MBL7173392.1 ABC transporter ATP-binding protein [Desulfobacteraceae bacterium]
MLEVTGVDLFYGDAQAVWDVSFHVDGEMIVALVGANGAGKSTLLHGISGIIRPKKGDILFSGISLINMKPEEVVTLGVSHVPEGRRLFSRLTVLENLELGAFPPRTRPFLKESLDRAFSLFPALKKRIHQTAGSLSGGEQQMLAIARAIMARPTLLMLDEPSLGLAPVMVKLMFEIIQALNREGVTILLVEQNVHQTLEIADHVYVLRTGRMELSGGGKDLLRNPDFQQAYLGMRG